MDYDKDKVDEATLALLQLGLSRTPTGGRAWKAFDLQTLARLHQKGWLAAPRTKDVTIEVTPEGMRRSEELFRKYFQTP